MSSQYSAQSLVSLPRLDAHEAITLAASIETAAVADPATGARVPLSMAVDMTLDDVVSARQALEAATVAHDVTPSTPEEREADRREDAAAGALHDVLAGWARLAGEVPEGDVAAELYRRIFGDDGLSFIQLPAKREWALVNDKLKLVADEGLESRFAALGAASLVTHLKRAHARYGEVLGVESDAPVVEPTEVREAREALLENLCNYVLQVTTAVDRRDPAGQELADALLRPVTDLRTRSAQ